MVEKVTRYTVEAVRGRLRWTLQAVEAPGAISAVDTLAQATEFMKEAIHIVTGEPEDSIEIDLVPILSDSTRAHLVRERELRQQAEIANAEAAAERRAAARELRDAGLSLKDVGTILGVSHQRASRLLSA